MKRVLFLACCFCCLSQVAFSADSAGVMGYQIQSEHQSKGIAVNCYDSEKGVGDQAICDSYSTYKNSSCEAIESTLVYDEPIYMCNPPGEGYCFKDSDCKVLGKNTCVVKLGSTNRFETQFEDESDMEGVDKIGICVAVGGSGESNAFGQAICNLMGVVTGNAGRAVVGVVVIVVGIMFFLGKVTWSLVLAIALGAGAIFGAPAIVSVVTGKPFTCK